MEKNPTHTTGRCSTFSVERVIFYPNQAPPESQMGDGSLVNFTVAFISRPSGTPRIQRVHIPFSEPLGIHIAEKVAQGSPEALTSLVSPILMVLIPLPCHTISFQTFTSVYLPNNTGTDSFAGCWLCVPPGQTHHHLLWPHPLSY